MAKIRFPFVVAAMATSSLACLGFSTSALADNTNAIYIQLDAEIYTESQPVNAFVDDFDKPLTEGDSAFTFNRLRIGGQWQNWQVGVQTRYDWWMEFDPDTALYTHLDKTNQPFESRRYRYFLDAKHMISNGLFVGYQWQIDKQWQLSATANLLTGAHFQDGTVDGYLNTSNDEAALAVDYYYSKDRLFKSFAVDERPTGWGASLDLLLRYQLDNNWSTEIALTDLAHFVKFTDSPYAVGVSREQPFAIDNGQISNQPRVEIQTHLGGPAVDHNLHLPVRARWSTTWRSDSWYGAALHVRRIAGDSFVQPQLLLQYSDDVQMQVGYQTHSKSWHLSTYLYGITLAWAGDASNLDDAHYMAFTVGYRYEF